MFILIEIYIFGKRKLCSIFLHNRHLFLRIFVDGAPISVSQCVELRRQPVEEAFHLFFDVIVAREALATQVFL